MYAFEILKKRLRNKERWEKNSIQLQVNLIMILSKHRGVWKDLRNEGKYV